MDVCLTNYGHCNYISGKHACIFYDEVSAYTILLPWRSASSCCTAVSKDMKVLYFGCGVNSLCVFSVEYQTL